MTTVGWPVAFRYRGRIAGRDKDICVGGDQLPRQYRQLVDLPPGAAPRELKVATGHVAGLHQSTNKGDPLLAVVRDRRARAE
jgi:hypothetical protein